MKIIGKSHIKTKIQSGERLRVLFINDVGFQYGAGIAHLRQIQSFLLLGHDVMGLCWMRGLEDSIPFIPNNARGHWAGMRQLPEVHPGNGYSEADIIRSIVQEVILVQPEIIIVGNLHGAKWPLELLITLRELDSVVVAYMHDCHLISGRCAYPGDCGLYEVGCNEKCPSANEYPLLAPHKIHNQWKLRREIFCGPKGVPIATNSHWLLGIVHQAFKNIRYAEVVYLGLDDQLFSPIDQTLVRQLLGLPDDAFVILSGSVHVHERRKGGHIFKEVVEILNKEDVVFLVFGEESLGLEGVRATGLLRDYRKMPLLFSAADLFLGMALEEAFGQTLCESSACGLPIAAFNVGGISEIARNNINARLVNEISVSGLTDEIEFFMRNPKEREAFGRAGREIIESEFTLERQGERWMEYLAKVASL